MNTPSSPQWRSHRRRGRQLPLGILTALLTACIATLIGVISGIEPFVILIRAGISALLLGLFVATGANVIRIANYENNKTQRPEPTESES